MKSLLRCLLGVAIGRWICYKLFDDFKPKKLITRRQVLLEDDDEGEDEDEDEGSVSIVETRDASPTHFLTKIESFSLFSTYGIDKYETREFESGDYKWRLIIYPNGHPSKKSDHVSVYLALAEPRSLPVDWEFNAIFTIFLYNQISDNYLCFHGNVRRFNETKSEWGFPKFISKKSLRDESNGYLVDDKFVLGAEVFVLKRQRVVEQVKMVKPSVYLRTRDWKIPEFSKLEDDWISNEFPMGGFNWKVKLIPKGDYSSKDLWMTIYLVCVSARTFNAHQKVNAEFSMRLKGVSTKHDLGKRSHWFTSSDPNWAAAFISLAQLHNPKNGFLVDDCCNLQAEISVQVVV